jgi:hypothetical protein
MEPAPPEKTCPQCGQKLPPGADTCAACGRNDVNPFSSPAAPIDPPAATSGLLNRLSVGGAAGALFASIVIGYFVPGLGILLCLLLVPASIRAAAVMRRQTAPASAAGQVGYLQALLVSSGVMFLVWLASTVAFTIVCFPLGLISFDVHSGGGAGLAFGLILGFASGLAVFVWLTRRFWPRAARNEDAVA